MNNNKFKLLFNVLFIFSVYTKSYANDFGSIYFSKSFLIQNKTPSIVANKISFQNTVTGEKVPETDARWFDDRPKQSSGNRTEVGIKNLNSGISISFRDQTIQGSHLGAASKYSCFIFFCAWIDASVVSGLNKNDQIDYRINFQQLWINKSVNANYFDFGFKGGINRISMSFDISGASNHVALEGRLPLPFVGTSIKYQITDKIDLIYDIHYSKVSKNGASLKFIDSELEFSYKISDSLKLSIGENRLNLNLKKQSTTSYAELEIPQRSPYLKVTLTY